MQNGPPVVVSNIGGSTLHWIAFTSQYDEWLLFYDPSTGDYTNSLEGDVNYGQQDLYGIYVDCTNYGAGYEDMGTVTFQNSENPTQQCVMNIGIRVNAPN